MPISEQRLTLFALISEFEADARDIISTFVCNDHCLEQDVGRETYEILTARASKQYSNLQIDDRLILTFFDIGDAIRTLLANRSLMPSALAAAITRGAQQLEAVPAIRNRVMHRRPLEFDDLPLVTDTMRDLVRTGVAEFGRLRSALRRLSDDGQLGSYEKAFSYEKEPNILNNLPQPDYEDTGFMGRREQIEELRKAIFGPFPVITVLGVGGAGKSALALQVAYDVLNSEVCAFDAIIWTSAKTTRLTGADVQNIAGAISSSIGIAESALDQFGVEPSGDPFDAVKELLTSFKVLLFIDNLETILDERVRDFVREVPVGSKVVFTSRISLGAYDFVVPIQNLGTKEADAYYRRVAGVWKQKELQQTPKEEVSQYLVRLNYSPLGIKWFIQAVSAGASIQRLLSDPTLLLTFCLQNIVEQLSKEARSLLLALAITGRENSPASLHFLTEIDPWTVEDALRELIGSHLITVIASRFGDDDRYRIAGIAQTYLTRLRSIPPAFQTNIQAKQQQLNAMAERAEAEQRRGLVYDPSYIVVRPEAAGTDAVAANYLRRAMTFARERDFDNAYAEIDHAKAIAPSYFEVAKVEGFIAANEGNILRAQGAYEEAVALRADHPPLLVLYAGFSLRSLGNGAAAEVTLKQALQIDPHRPEIRMELARALLYQRKFDEAWDVLRATQTSNFKNARAWRMFCDLQIQTCSRAVEHAFANGVSVTLETGMERLRSVVTEMPSYAFDEQSEGHLRSAVSNAQRFMKREGYSPAAGRVKEALDVICTAVGITGPSSSANVHQLVGRVDTLPADRPFGFIASNLNTRMFFHRANMLNVRDFERLRVGSAVTFSIGSNAQGPCADEVQLVE